MYDSLNFYLGCDEVAGGDLLASLTHLTNVTEHIKDGHVSYSGWLKNFKASVSHTGLSLKGSLAKYYLDDNIKTLNRGDSQRAIEQLSDELHLPMQNAKVTRIDFAHNMLMKYEPETYYQYLGDCQYYKRLIQPQSLYYSNSQRVKLFYNKLAEAKKAHVVIPDIIANANLLRFEIRYISRLSAQLKTQVFAKKLFDERFYMQMVDRWVKEYQDINKNNLINLNLQDMNSPKDFWKQGNLHWLKIIGQDTALRLVDDMKARQVFDKPEYYSRLKREIKELCSMPDLTEKSELIEELDLKISKVKHYYH